MARRRGHVPASALRALRSADPVPANGPALVRYMGGTKRATQVLSGLDRGPTAAERRADPEGTKGAYDRWRAASRQAQRWAKGERGAVKDVSKELDDRQRRAAQAENRDRKRREAGAAGIRAQLVDTRIVIVSGKAGRRDSRRRSILHDPDDGRRGVLVEDHVALLAAVEAGELEEAAKLLADGFLERCGLPGLALDDGAGTSLDAPQWILWPDGEDPPADALGGER